MPVNSAYHYVAHCDSGNWIIFVTRL